MSVSVNLGNTTIKFPVREITHEIISDILSKDLINREILPDVKVDHFSQNNVIPVSNLPIIYSNLSFKEKSCTDFIIKKSINNFANDLPKEVIKILSLGNVLLAGGSVVCYFIKFCTRFRNFYETHEVLSNDYDLFIYGLNETEANVKVKEILKLFADSDSDSDSDLELDCNSRSEIYSFTINENCLNILKYNNPFIQVIFRLYKSKSEILHGFDIGCCQLGFDLNGMYATMLGEFCYENNLNIFDHTRRSPNYENRLMKYLNRGFNILLPDCAKIYNDCIKLPFGYFKLSYFDLNLFTQTHVTVSNDKFNNCVYLSKINDKLFIYPKNYSFNNHKVDDELETNEDYSDNNYGKSLEICKLINANRIDLINFKMKVSYCWNCNDLNFKIQKLEIHNDISDAITNSIMNYYKSYQLRSQPGLNKLSKVGKINKIKENFIYDYKKYFPVGNNNDYIEAKLNYLYLINVKNLKKYCDNDCAELITKTYSEYFNKYFTSNANCFSDMDKIIESQVEKYVNTLNNQRKKLQKINWRVQNPGEQLTGSFHPIKQSAKAWYGKFYMQIPRKLHPETFNIIKKEHFNKRGLFGMLPKDVLFLIYNEIIN